jgi:hypothetical protein
VDSFCVCFPVMASAGRGNCFPVMAILKGKQSLNRNVDEADNSVLALDQSWRGCRSSVSTLCSSRWDLANLNLLMLCDVDLISRLMSHNRSVGD